MPMAPKRDYELEEAPVADAKERLQRPSMFKVLLHNDNYTTMEFVVFVLIEVFSKGEAEAFRIMLQVHQEGIGVAGIYPFEIAETKAARVEQMARDNEYPLMCTVEEA